MIKDEILARLKTNFKIFFRQSIKHYVKIERQNEDEVLAIFSLQQALELLLKIYYVEENGYKSILCERDRSLDETEQLRLLHSGDLKTLGYSKILGNLRNSRYCPLSESDYSMIENFQKARNQIAHLGLEMVSNDLLEGVLQLVTSVFTDLEYKDRVSYPFEGELVNVLKLMLGKELYRDFINNTKLREYARKKAENTINGEIHYCIECEEKTVIDEGHFYKCMLCGFSVSKDCATIIKCPVCGANDMYVDILNTTPTNEGGGRCLKCHALLSVLQCDECEDYYVVDCGSCFCGKHKPI